MTIVRAISRIDFYFRRHRYSQAYWRIVVCAVLVLAFSSPLLAANTTVRIVTIRGTIDIELYDDQAPKTVANFLRYAGRGDYTFNGFFHYTARDNTGAYGIRAGGYTYFYDAGSPIYIHIPEDPPVSEEVSPPQLNSRGTIAMFKPPNNPDRVTSEWMLNLADNPNSINIVFGQVVAGMNVADDIGSIQNYDAHNTFPAFTSIPLINYDPTVGGLQPSNLVSLTSIPNVTATKTLTTQTTSAYAADPDVTLQNPNSNTIGSISYTTVDVTTSEPWLASFTPPPGKTVQFNDEISRFTMTWTTGPTSRVVTLYHGANASVNAYYAYGPTPDNPTPHWYDFSYDGKTGAEFVGNKILLHFVDGQRGDDDLTADPTAGSITHTGAPVLVTDIPTSSPTSVGCTIAATPSPMTSHGDWIVVSMFLTFVALVRRRKRLDQAEGARH